MGLTSFISAFIFWFFFLGSGKIAFFHYGIADIVIGAAGSKMLEDMEVYSPCRVNRVNPDCKRLSVDRHESGADSGQPAPWIGFSERVSCHDTA